MKPKILFVDDEQHILDSMKVMLRSMRGQWDMLFASSGQEALLLLEEQACDVVVSDMRMPGMDGLRLLQEVQSRKPECIRIILSGFSEWESQLRSVRIAHQFLSKPCPSEDLKQAILDSLQLRDVVRGNALKRIIAKIEGLPVLSRSFDELSTELQDEGASLETIGDIVSRDIGMTTNLLRLVNSAFFGLPTKVASVHHAVKLLGVETIRGLVLYHALFSSLPNEVFPDFSFELLWEHSIRVSCFSKAIAAAEGLEKYARDDCFIGGLLHDVGKLLLATSLAESYVSVIDEAQEGKYRVHELEKEIFGASHAEVGAYLLSIWGFSSAIVETVCWHHEPGKICLEAPTPRTIVGAANAMDHALVTFSQGRALRRVEDLCVADEELAKRMQKWREVCQKLVKE